MPILRANKHFSFYGAVAYTDGKYVKFTNAPLPLEETGNSSRWKQVAFKDISGGELPGISKWAASLGGEFTTPRLFWARPEISSWHWMVIIVLRSLRARRPQHI